MTFLNISIDLYLLIFYNINLRKEKIMKNYKNSNRLLIHLLYLNNIFTNQLYDLHIGS